MSVEDNLLSIIETREFDNHKRYQILEDLLVEFNITKIRSSLAVTLSEVKEEELRLLGVSHQILHMYY